MREKVYSPPTTKWQLSCYVVILIYVQYLQNLFSFEEGSNGQNPASDSYHPIKKSPQQNFLFPPRGGGGIFPYPLTLFGKPYLRHCSTYENYQNLVTLAIQWSLSSFFDFDN